MGGHDESNGLHAVEYTTAIAHDAVDQLTPFPDLRLRFGGGVDGDILYFVCALQIGIAADPYVFYDLAVLDNGAIPDLTIVASSLIEDLFCEFLEFVLQSLVIPEAAP